MARLKSGRVSKAAARSKRQKELAKVAALDPRWLDEDAPQGAYYIDFAVEQVLCTGFVSTVNLARIRHDVSQEAQRAVALARGALLRQPQRVRKVKRFFKDMEAIRKRIARNLDVHPLDITLSTTLIPLADRPFLNERAVRSQLLHSLQNTGVLIDEFLKRHEPRGNPGNHDPLTRGFLDGMIDRWSEWFGEDPNKDQTREQRLFVDFCVAAWRDVGFPTKDEDGERPEDWLFDRVRKQFPRGVRAERADRQRQMSSDFEPPEIEGSPELPEIEDSRWSDDDLALKRRAKDLGMEALAFDEIKTEEEYEQAADVLNEIKKVNHCARERWREARRPYEEAAAAVDRKWNAFKERVENLMRKAGALDGGANWPADMENELDRLEADAMKLKEECPESPADSGVG
jgi:hypothetical protein